MPRRPNRPWRYRIHPSDSFAIYNRSARHEFKRAYDEPTVLHFGTDVASGLAFRRVGAVQAFPRARASVYPMRVHSMLLSRLLLPKTFPLPSVPAVHPVAQLLLPQAAAMYLVHSHGMVLRRLLQETMPSPVLASS